MNKKLYYTIPIILLLSACNNQENSSSVSENSMHEHSYHYEYDSRYHYQVCSCDNENKINLEAHSFKEVIDGSTIKTYCEVCNYEKSNTTIATLVEGIKYVDNTFYIESEKGLLNFAAILNGTNDNVVRTRFQNSTIKLTKNLDMEDYNWTPICEEISSDYETQYHKDSYLDNMCFDGANYTISNLNVSGDKSVAFIGITSSSFTIQNLTFDHAIVNSTSGWVGVVIGYSSNEVVINNVKVTNSQIGSLETSYKVGSLIGMAQLAFGSIKISDCEVSNSTFSGKNNVGGLVGQMTGTENCTFINNSVTNCIFNIKENADKCSPFAVWDENYMKLDRENNEKYFNNNTNCSNNLSKDNTFTYEQ